MRTTLDIDEPILKEIHRLRKAQGRSMGRIVSDLLAQALVADRDVARQQADFHWHSRPMGARVDLADHDAVYDAMENGHQEEEPA